MTAQIIQFVPRPNPNRPTLVEQAEKMVEEFLEAAPELKVPYGGAGIDGMPYQAPPEDCA